jgi:5'(3')-deoxyribonucleotidase
LRVDGLYYTLVKKKLSIVRAEFKFISHSRVFFSHNKIILAGLSAAETMSQTTRKFIENINNIYIYK